MHRHRHHSMHITYTNKDSQKRKMRKTLQLNYCRLIIATILSLFLLSHTLFKFILSVRFFFSSSFSLCNNWIIVRAQTGKIDDAADDDYVYKKILTHMRHIQNSKILYRKQVKPALSH